MRSFLSWRATSVHKGTVTTTYRRTLKQWLIYSKANMFRCLNPMTKDTTAHLIPPESSITDMSFSLDDIINAIDEIDNYSSTSHECIPASILKACKKHLWAPIHILWDHSFVKGKVPQPFKHQFITPIHKKDREADAKTISQFHWHPTWYRCLKHASTIPRKPSPAIRKTTRIP